MDANQQLLALIDELLRSETPVSFYDAMGVVADARKAGELSDQALAAMLALHDARVATDGARQVLGELLSMQAERQSEERARGARPLTLADADKTVRVKVGGVVTLELAERRSTGYRWEAELLSAGLQIERLEGPPEKKSARLRVHLLHPGDFHLELSERRPAALEGTDNGPSPRRFGLRIRVELA